jgi:hypothetical protein
MRSVAICLAALAFSGGCASSQENINSLPSPQQDITSLPSPERAPTAAAWPAPVGHRQPKMSDLPPDLARREMQPGEQSDRPTQRDLDSRLTICRGC